MEYTYSKCPTCGFATIYHPVKPWVKQRVVEAEFLREARKQAEQLDLELETDNMRRKVEVKRTVIAPPRRV